MARRTLPSLNSLRAFETFARLRSMTRAAEELGVTPDIASGRLVAPWGFTALDEPFVFLRPRGSNAATETFGAWLMAEGRRTPRPPHVT